MDVDRTSSSEEDLSPIIPIKARKRNSLHKGPAHRSTSHLVPKEPVHPQDDAELPAHVEESYEIAQRGSTNETPLLDKLKNKKVVNVNNFVDDWIQSYKVNREKAFLKIVQLILDASGLIGTATPEMMKIENCDSILEMPTDDETGKGLYPIIRQGRMWKSFSVNFGNFIQTLMKSCEDSEIIYDDYFMTSLFAFLGVLKNCLWRPLRHSTMLTVLKLTSPLIDIVLKMNEKRLEKQCDDLNGKLLKIKKMLKIVVKEVLPLSHRDRCVTVRILTITELFIWMQKYPEFFVNVYNIYFIRVNLNDKLFEVRTECVQVFQWLYDRPEYRKLLTKLNDTIKSQIARMFADKKPEMIMQVIKLFKTMVLNKYISSHDKDTKYIQALVYSPNQDIGRLAGQFLDMQISDKLNYNEPRRNVYKKYITSLVQFSIQMKLEKVNYVLIDSLMEVTPFIKKWESYVELLLEGFNSVHASQDDPKELVLIDLMVHCVEQVATGVSPAPRDPEAKSKILNPLSWKKSDDRRNMTTVFLQNLSPLLNKFLPSVEKISRLMEIPKYFDADELSSNFVHNQENLLTLIGDFQIVNATYPDRFILSNFVMALTTFSDVDSSLQNECSALQLDLIKVCLEKFVAIANDHYQDETMSGNDPSQNSDNSKNLRNALMVLSIFFEHHNLNKCDVMEEIFPFIQFYLQDSSRNNMAFVYALRCSYYSLIWNVTETFKLDPSERQESLLRLQHLFKKCIDIYEFVITHNSERQAKVEAFFLICNSLMFQWESFSKNTNDPNLDKSMYKPTLNTCKALNMFVQQTVFEIKGQGTKENRNLLVFYCKLIINSVISVKKAVDIIQHYNVWTLEYGDIIKNMMNEILDRNKNNAFIITSICLRSMFVQIKETCGEVKISEKHFLQLKDLAKNLALLLPSNINTRKFILKMHMNAISFTFDGWNHSENGNRMASCALLPPNLNFLGILFEFGKKLNRNDKELVVKFLDRHVGNDLKNVKGIEWLSFNLYRAQLLR